MPKRVIDADAMWQSEKLARCRPESVPEYAWLYGLADANGNFELTNMRTLHGKAYAPIRHNFTIENLRSVLADFERHGLLYTWTDGTKKFGHWTGSEKPGRLPPLGQRSRYSGNLAVKRLYGEADQPTDSGLLEYLERTANAEPEPQIALPLVDRSEAALSIRREAEKTVDAAAANSEHPEFRKFKQLYPPVGWVHESYTRQIFQRLASDGITLVKIFEGLAVHVKSGSWKSGYIVNCDKFLDQRYWEKPPRENVNGNRIGPAGRTTEDYAARKKQNRQALGLDNK